MDYLYDETFDGLLTCIYCHYYEEKATGIYSYEHYQQDLLKPFKQITTDQEKAKKVAKAIRQKISFLAFYHIHSVFLSNDGTKENKILNYLVYGFKIGKQIDDYYTHPWVQPIHKLSKQVNFETHRFSGLIRFVEIGSLLYTGIEPDHNILPKLAEHFIDRFKDENFIIHDTRRNLALAYNKEEWIITPYEQNKELPLSEKEKHFQKLWQGYFNNISISNRENKALQQQFVPLKYRKYLTEFQVIKD
jgi:probable DNA metabolism protein